MKKNVAPLVEKGIVGFKLSDAEADPVRFPRIEDGVLWETFQTISPYGLPVGFHAENDRIILRLSSSRCNLPPARRVRDRLRSIQTREERQDETNDQSRDPKREGHAVFHSEASKQRVSVGRQARLDSELNQDPAFLRRRVHDNRSS